MSSPQQEVEKSWDLYILMYSFRACAKINYRNGRRCKYLSATPFNP